MPPGLKMIISDQDAEHHRLRPLLAREEPEATVVETLDDTDQDAADDGTEEVADTAEHRRRERDRGRAGSRRRNEFAR